MSKLYEAAQHAGLDLGAQSVISSARGAVALEDRLRTVPELVNLYYLIQSMRAPDRPLVVQFMAATPREGTSSIARGFAEVATHQPGGRVLLAACGGVQADAHGRGAHLSLAAAVKGDHPLESAVAVVPTNPSLDTARLSDAAHPLLDLDATSLVKLFDAVRGTYDITVLDCAAGGPNPDSVALSRFCDGTILVIRAETVRSQVVEAVRRSIERSGGNIVGAVLNGRRRYIPSWLYKLL